MWSLKSFLWNRKVQKADELFSQLAMTRFEPWSSDVGSDCISNWAILYYWPLLALPFKYHRPSKRLLTYFIRGSITERLTYHFDALDLTKLVYILFIQQLKQGREPWSSGYGRRLTFLRLWVGIPVPYTGWTFFTLICCKLVLMFVWIRPKINGKEAGDGPF